MAGIYTKRVISITTAQDERPQSAMAYIMGDNILGSRRQQGRVHTVF